MKEKGGREEVEEDTPGCWVEGPEVGLGLGVEAGEGEEGKGLKIPSSSRGRAEEEETGLVFGLTEDGLGGRRGLGDAS
jgi:hypothetical protein